MSSEGSREIEAARKRLVAAKTHASSASSNLDKARSMMTNANSMMAVAESNMKIANSMMSAATAATKSAESMKKTAEGNIADAETQMNTAQEEVEDAEKFLKEAEKRWEVVDVDAPTELQSEGAASRKKRKVSLSPTAASINEDSAAPDDSDDDITTFTSFSERLAQARARLEKQLRNGASSDDSSAGSDANDVSDAAGKSSQTVFHKVPETHTSTWSEVLPSGFFKHELKSDSTLLPCQPGSFTIATTQETFHQTGHLKDLKILSDVKLNNILRVYTMEVDKHDVELFSFSGRHIVEDESSWYLTKPTPKPKAGAFIVAINDRLLPLGITTREVDEYYLYGLRGDKVKMTFVEDYDFMSMYAEDIVPNLPQLREAERRKKQEKRIRSGEIVGLVCDEGKSIEVEGKSVEKISVSSCGVPEANGVFLKSSNTHDGVPMYVKTGMWQGKEESFWIFRRELKSNKTWHLLVGGKLHSGSGIQKPVAYLFSVDCSCYGRKAIIAGSYSRKADPLYNVPPKSGWKLAKSSKGVGPFPQLKWE